MKLRNLAAKKTKVQLIGQFEWFFSSSDATHQNKQRQREKIEYQIKKIIIYFKRREATKKTKK